MKSRAKTFMYVSFGVLALVAAFQLGASVSKADFNPQAGWIVGITGTDTVLTDDGRVWNWQHLPEVWGVQNDGLYDLPMPLSQVAMWASHNAFVSVDGEVWANQSGTGWVNRGAPDGPVPVRSQSASELKSMFR